MDYETIVCHLVILFFNEAPSKNVEIKLWLIYSINAFATS